MYCVAWARAKSNGASSGQRASEMEQDYKFTKLQAALTPTGNRVTLRPGSHTYLDNFSVRSKSWVPCLTLPSILETTDSHVSDANTDGRSLMKHVLHPQIWRNVDQHSHSQTTTFQIWKFSVDSH